VFGCALTVSLNSTTSRKYTVPTQYRTRGDAKLAVALHAVEEGVLEFIRFRGGDPPDDYDRDAYDANQMGLTKRPIKQVPSPSSCNQPSSNDTLRKRKSTSKEDHRHSHHRSPDLHTGLISREEHYIDTSSRTGGRWDSFSQGGLHGPHGRYSYPDYPLGRNQYHTAAYLSPPHVTDDRSPSFMPVRRAVYSGTYHDLDHPMSSDRGMPQAYPHSYYPWHDDDERSFYSHWSHPSRASASRDYPVLDYSNDEGHSVRYFSRAPEPLMGADDARHASRSHSVSRASADHTSIEPGPAVPNAAPSVPHDLAIPERHPRSYVRPSLDSIGPPPQQHLSRLDWTSLATSSGSGQRKGLPDRLLEPQTVHTESTHDGVREDVPTLPPNESVLSSKEYQSRSRGPDQPNEVSLRERAKASRKRHFSMTSESDVYSRRWQKSVYSAH
jgi:hypothetical protein